MPDNHEGRHAPGVGNASGFGRDRKAAEARHFAGASGFDPRLGSIIEADDLT
jgi:hypothetical protein